MIVILNKKLLRIAYIVIIKESTLRDLYKTFSMIYCALVFENHTSLHF